MTISESPSILPDSSLGSGLRSVGPERARSQVNSPKPWRKLEERSLSASESPTQYLSEIMEREVETVAQFAQARRKRRLPLLLLLLGAAIGLTGWNVLQMTLSVRAIGTGEEEASAAFTLYLVAQALELYRDSAGSWPPNLAVVRADDGGVEYTLTDGGYVLAATVGGTLMTYRSGEDLSRLARAYQLLARDQMR